MLANNQIYVLKRGSTSMKEGRQHISPNGHISVGKRIDGIWTSSSSISSSHTHIHLMDGDSQGTDTLL